MAGSARAATARASVIIASHNEGDCLSRTVVSTVRAIEDLDCEVLIADDASRDGSVEDAVRRCPGVQLVRTARRRGVSYTKNVGARRARGKVLVFIDGHCKPERCSISRLVRGVEDLDGECIVTPRIPDLHVKTWTNKLYRNGFGFRFTLEDFDCDWLDLDDMRRRGDLYESPSVVGCCLALSRKLYSRLHGFDAHMLQWGVEDLDLSFKCWLMGHPILNDPWAAIGHRFRAHAPHYTIDLKSVAVNKLRMARKNFGDAVWREWLRKTRSRYCGSTHSRGFWREVWSLFNARRKSVEKERGYLMRNRVRDEFWYADRFGLGWPSQPLADGG